MDTRSRQALLITALAASALLIVGCEQRGSSDSATSKASQSASKMADQASQTANKVADQASQTANKVADQASQATTKVAEAADDTTITTKVKAALLAEPGLKSLQINVDTKDATVTLTGNVATNDMRERAKQVASSVSGVKNVIDDMTVKTG